MTCLTRHLNVFNPDGDTDGDNDSDKDGDGDGEDYDDDDDDPVDPELQEPGGIPGESGQAEEHHTGLEKEKHRQTVMKTS